MTAPKRRPVTESERARLLRMDAEMCERSLHQFVRQAWHIVEPDRTFADNWHIVGICEHLEAVAFGTLMKLLINVPPGTMKSLLVCVLWPAWVWCRKPEKRFMFTSYADNLALRDSVKCRDVIASGWYQERWPLQFANDQNAKGKFENVRRGWRMVGSIRGQGTGEHPDYNCFDDPHNVLAAESEADIQTVSDWVEAVFSTRGVISGVRQVGVMQRIAPGDASGVALAKGGWTHICLPMRFEEPEERELDGRTVRVPRMSATPLGWKDPRQCEGELLWPAKYPESVVAKLENDMGVFRAAGQLQQRPAPRGGAMFNRAWFQVMALAPNLTRLVRYWDKAGTASGRGAQSAGLLMGQYVDQTAAIPAQRNKWIVLHVVAGRWAAAQREAVIKQTAEADRAKWGYVQTWVEQEPGSGGLESAESTVSNLAGFTVFVERVTGSKEVRAEPLQAQASVGNVRMLAGDWNEQLLGELETFPLGKLKDMVDAASGAFNKMRAETGALGGSELFTGGSSVDFGESSSPIEFQRLGKEDF